jgi:carbon storage regulator
MLVLSRHEREVIEMRLPDGQIIAVSVVKVKGSTVRLGIEAPEDVHILRGELVGTMPRPAA